MVLPGVGGLFVQALLFACCVGVFYIKRKKEQKQLGEDARTKEEFFLDASKQFASAGWIHIMNLGFASMLNDMMSGGDECVWYWINIMVDTTIGTAVAYVLLKIAMAFVRKRLGDLPAEDFKPGEYRGQDGIIDIHKYGKQLILWLAVVSCMKILMVLCMFLFSGPLLAIAGFILAPFLTQPWLKLLVVMIAFPILMDGLQIWMVDNFLKKRMSQSHEGELLQDAEQGSDYVEKVADALLVCSHRVEEASEDALAEFKARVDEAMHLAADQGQEGAWQQQDYVKRRAEYPEGKMEAAASGNFDTHPHCSGKTGGEFETQFQFQTMIPPDQAMQ